MRYTLLRYVPDVVKGEFVNLGVIVLGDDGLPREARMAGEEELRRLRCLHPQADLDLIRELTGRFTADLSWPDLDRLREDLSNTLVLTDPKFLLAEDAWAEAETLFHQYVAAPPRDRERPAQPRLQLKERLQHRLRTEGLLDFLKPFPVERFTAAGDRFQIDYAYTPVSNGRNKYLHVVTLDRAPHQAKALAFSFERIQRQRRLDSLTAICGQEAGGPIKDLLESSGIAVAPYTGIDSLIRGIRADLALT
jgi:hypothetical protein